MSIRLPLLLLAVLLLSVPAAAQNGYGPGPAGPPADVPALLARSLLERPDSAPDPDAIGRVEILSVETSGRERFRVVCCHLDASADFTVRLDDGADGIHDLAMASDETGRAELDVDTAKGDDLPGGVSAVSDLTGWAVSVLDKGEAILLVGTVPSFEDDLGRPWRARRRIQAARQDGGADGDGLQAKVKLRHRSRDRERLQLKVNGLQRDEECQLWVEDAESGEMRLALQLRANHRGRVKLKLKAKGDEELMPGCGGAGDLAGLRFEIRNRNEVRVMSGVFPTP